MADPAEFPISDNLAAPEMLAAASRRPFEEVVIIGRYGGMLRHASTMNIARQLHLIEAYKLILLGVASQIELGPSAPVETDAEEPDAS